MPPPKRKKWTEEEELTLITKYSDLQSDGSLSRLRTREKKFRPIADAVNSAHHSLDPNAFPFLWSWKDASTKVQNMRHQYLLVKQKLISALPTPQSDGHDLPVNWSDGVSFWPNFLHYRQVFGDAPLPAKPSEAEEEEFVDGDLGLGFDGEEDNNGFDYAEPTKRESPPPLPWRRKKKKRRDLEEREWEERMERRREEWRRRVEGMMAQHRAHMAEIHARVVAEQQAVVGQLLGIVSHWAGGGADCVAPMNGVGVAAVAPEENRGEDHQLIVDG